MIYLWVKVVTAVSDGMSTGGERVSMATAHGGAPSSLPLGETPTMKETIGLQGNQSAIVMEEEPRGGGRDRSRSLTLK